MTCYDVTTRGSFICAWRDRPQTLQEEVVRGRVHSEFLSKFHLNFLHDSGSIFWSENILKIFVEISQREDSSLTSEEKM